ncbi:MAG: tRNA (adenosine(37)-N6)-threonylcarbamoyltransferase complex ATPase subunit type 1 TsaE [Planctomycetota bacterium]
MPELVLVSRSPEETRGFGRRVGGAIDGRGIVFLEGELGSGKTHFTKGLYGGQGGADEDIVVSPSYQIIHRYDGARRPFYHVDLYRLEDPRHLLGLEYEDFLFLNPGLTAVEWPRDAAELLGADEILEVRFEYGDDESERRLRLRAEGDRYARVFEELSAR